MIKIFLTIFLLNPVNGDILKSHKSESSDVFACVDRGESMTIAAAKDGMKISYVCSAELVRR